MSKPKTQDNALEFAETTALWDELKRRYDAVLLVLEVDATADGSRYMTHCWWKGTTTHALGLAGYGATVIQQQINEVTAE